MRFAKTLGFLRSAKRVGVLVVLVMFGGLLVLTQQLSGQDRLLIAAHRTTGVTCAQCHQEKPPARSPSSNVCLTCHGDQQALAKKTEGASPNPHAAPHATPGETQVCTECHHVHRPSEVTCTSCHRDFFFNVK
jgi:Cytochrome c3